MHFLYDLAVYAIPLIFAITMHEAAHGWMAERFGDDTASMMGRVTLNPIPHIDLVGTIIVPGDFVVGVGRHRFRGSAFGVGQAVPVNTRNLRPFRQGMFMVALAGPLSNLLQALFWLLMLKLFILTGFLTQSLLDLTIAGVMVNFYLMAF